MRFKTPRADVTLHLGFGYPPVLWLFGQYARERYQRKKEGFDLPTFSGPRTAIALVIVLGAWLVSRLARRSLMRVLGRVNGLHRDVQLLIARLSGYLVLFAGVGFALTVLGAQSQPFLAAVLVILLLAALALRRVADNFAAGIILQARHPLGLDEEVEAMGHTGVVSELNSRSVVLETLDGSRVHLPNHQLLDEPMVNHSRRGARRSELEVRVPPAADPKETLAALERIAAGAPGVLAEPPPSALAMAWEPERMTVQLRVWHAPLDRVVVSAVVTAIAADHELGALTVIAPPPVAPLTPPANL
jgi:small conductance mechanosensitive channel